MKKFIIGLVLETVFDLLLATLQKAAMRSSSNVDDKIVATLAEERDQIIADIKRQL